MIHQHPRLWGGGSPSPILPTSRLDNKSIQIARLSKLPLTIRDSSTLVAYPLWPTHLWVWFGLIDISIFSPIVKLGWWNLPRNPKNFVQVVSDLTNLKSLINLTCNTIKGTDRAPKSPEFLPYSHQKSPAEWLPNVSSWNFIWIHWSHPTPQCRLGSHFWSLAHQSTTNWATCSCFKVARPAGPAPMTHLSH